MKLITPNGSPNRRPMKGQSQRQVMPKGSKYMNMKGVIKSIDYQSQYQESQDPETHTHEISSFNLDGNVHSNDIGQTPRRVTEINEEVSRDN